MNNIGVVVGISIVQDDIFNRIAHDPCFGRRAQNALVARGGAIIFHSAPWIMNDGNITTIFDLPKGEFLSKKVISLRLSTPGHGCLDALIDVIPSYAVQDPIAQKLTDILIPIGLARTLWGTK